MVSVSRHYWHHSTVTADVGKQDDDSLKRVGAKKIHALVLMAWIHHSIHLMHQHE
jgi:hypothetical protein